MTAGKPRADDWDDWEDPVFDVQQGSATPAGDEEDNTIRDLLLELTGDAVKLRQLLLEADHETFELARDRLEGLLEIVHALPERSTSAPRPTRVIGFKPQEPKKSRGARKPRRR